MKTKSFANNVATDDTDTTHTEEWQEKSINDTWFQLILMLQYLVIWTRLSNFQDFDSQYHGVCIASVVSNIQVVSS